MLNGNNVLAVSPAVVVQNTGDELVVVIPDQGKYVVLNQTGARIVQMADGKQTLSEIAAAISVSTGENLEQVLTDVIAFTGDLTARGILNVAEADTD